MYKATNATGRPMLYAFVSGARTIHTVGLIHLDWSEVIESPWRIVNCLRTCRWKPNQVRSVYSLADKFLLQWGMSITHSWRKSGDIYNSFTRPDALCSCDDPRNSACIAPSNDCSILNIIDKIASYADREQPGGWNDMDLLELGQGG
jgi:hypothetical protein